MDKKYTYNIGYSSYEESAYVQMCFDKKLSNKKLEEYVQKAAIIALTKALNNEYENNNYIFWGLSERGITFQDLFEYIIKELENMGFEKVEYDAQFGCFGWASIVTDTEIDWSLETRGTEIDRLRKVIPDELKKRALKKAKQQEEEDINA